MNYKKGLYNLHNRIKGVTDVLNKSSKLWLSINIHKNIAFNNRSQGMVCNFPQELCYIEKCIL